jgi:hypothetical protein
MKNLKQLATLLGIVAIIFSAWFVMDARWAKCAEVKAIERRLDYKIESDKLNASQARLWTLEDRYGADPDKVQNPEVKAQMKELKATVSTQENRVKALER